LVVGRSQKGLQKNQTAAEWRCEWSKGLVGNLSWKKGEVNFHLIGTPPTRQAYLGVASGNGDPVVVGFVAGKGGLEGAKCNDDILLARLSQDGRAVHSEVLSQGKGDDLLFDVQPAQKGFIAVGYTSDATGKQTKGLVITVDRELRSLGPPRLVDAGSHEPSRLEFVTRPSSRGLFLAGGRTVTKRANATTFDALLVTLRADGTINAVQTVNTNASQRALSGTFSADGNAIVVGQAWTKASTNTEQGLGWVYVLPAAEIGKPESLVAQPPAMPPPSAPAAPSPVPPIPSIVDRAAPPAPPQPRERQKLTLRDLPKKDGLRIVDPTKQIAVNDIATEAPVRLGFSLARTTTVRILARPASSEGADGARPRHAGLLLLGADGSLIDFSDYSGAAVDIIQATLEVGTYEVRLVTADRDARFELTVEPIQRPLSKDASQPSLTLAQRLAVVEALTALGYFPGSYPQLGFGAETERAIAAYQSSLGEEPTGRLTSEQLENLMH
jgi:hypothetical protein